MDDSNRAKKLKRNDSSFLQQFEPSDLRIASEFLTKWLPFLSHDLCRNCTQILSHRILSLNEGVDDEAEVGHLTNGIASLTQRDDQLQNSSNHNCNHKLTGNSRDGDHTSSWKDVSNRSHEPVIRSTPRGILGASPIVEKTSLRMSWADMAQEDELEEEEDHLEMNGQVVDGNPAAGDLSVAKVVDKPTLSREQREHIRFMNVRRKKDFVSLESFKGKMVNILEGLELHTCVFSAAEQKRIVDCVYDLEEKGRRGELRERTYTAPQKWMKGKGRVTIQFGCCYNYAMDKEGNPPGILKNKLVDPIPDLFKVMIRRLIKWHVLLPNCVPDSCIVNIYEEGDCIPPHIDNHDFVRPFSTVSFLSQCDIVFGTNLKVLGPGEFAGSYALPLPVGSVLVLQGNGADVAKHCVPSVPTKRISITFRKMDETKRPIGFVPEPDLEGLQPLLFEPQNSDLIISPRSENNNKNHFSKREVKFETRRDDRSWSEPRYSNRGRERYTSKWRR